MITLFSTCKPFCGVYEHIQYNALHSWSLLEPRPNVILFGDDTGTAEAARTFGFEHVPDVRSHGFTERDIGGGPPRHATKPSVPGMFHTAMKMTDGDLLVYVNADILLTNLTSEFLRVRQQLLRFLLVGQRYNVTIEGRLDFRGDWVKPLRAVGKLHPPCGIDYIAFTKGMWKSLPDFAVGYVGFDNYLVFTALAQCIPVVDGTATILAIHQEHPFRRRKDAGDRHNLNTWGKEPWNTRSQVSDATWILDAQGVRQKIEGVEADATNGSS